jgi:lysine 6-dehydrogenase
MVKDGYRYGVVGGGMQGCAAGYDLLRHGEGRSVVFFDRDPAVARRAASRVNRLLGGRRASARALDAANVAAATQAFAGLHGVLSAAPYALNPGIALAAVAAGACVNDLGGNTEVVRRTLELDRGARLRGVSVMPDCGLAPGLGNTLAASLVATVPGLRSVRVRCGGLPQIPRPPLGYKLVFHIGGLTNEYMGEAEFLRNGRLVRVPTLGERETLDVRGIGTLEAAVTSGGTSLAPETFRGVLRDYDYKTLRYPGHWDGIVLLRDLGLLDEAPLDVDGVAVSPRAVFHRAAAPKLSFPQDRDLVVLRVVGEGGSARRPVRRTIELIDRHDARTGFTAMERTTAFPAAAVLHFQVRGLVPPGACTPERNLPFADYVAAVRKRGLRLRETTDAG